MLYETWGRKIPDMLLASTAAKLASADLYPDVKRGIGGVFLFLKLEEPDWFLLSTRALHMLTLHPDCFLPASPDSHYILGQYYFPLEPHARSHSSYMSSLFPSAHFKLFVITCFCAFLFDSISPVDCKLHVIRDHITLVVAS